MKLLICLSLCVFSVACSELISGLSPDVTFRLVGGVTTRDGRLEVFYNNSWGSICDDGFDDIAAGVACANLGFGHDGKFVENRFGPGTGPIWLDDLRCIGTEPSLAECRHNLWGVHDCAHKQDVSIVCLPIVPVELRLVGGLTAREGRLEVKYNETWGTICDDGFNDIEATVACSSLGFRNGGRFMHNTYGPGTGKIWLDNVRCISTESSLAQCRHNGWGEHDCAHKEDVSIACMSPTTTTHAPTTKTTTTARAVLPTTIPPACLSSSRPTNINSASGWFASPNYPNNYDNNMDCEWLIEAPFMNGLVTLTLHDFDLESCCDWMEVYDGDTTLARVIATVESNYYSTYDRSYTTSQRYMLVRFHSDYSLAYRGFNATFSSTEERSTTTTTTTTTTTETKINHQVLWDTDGTITSPNYPLNYDPYTDVSWLIRSTDPNKVISLTFTEFDTESTYDVCTVYDGEDEWSATLASLSGTGAATLSHDWYWYDDDTTPTYTTTSNSMYITFSSDYLVQSSGFRATFRIKPRTGDTETSTSRPTTSTSRTATTRRTTTATTRTSTVTRAAARPTISATSTMPHNVNSSRSTSMSRPTTSLQDGGHINDPRINLTAGKDVYTTTQHYMFVRFTSEDLLTALGLRAKYSTTEGSKYWILIATVIATSTCSVLGIWIIIACVRRRRLQRTRDLRRRYIALRSESDDNEELEREKQPHSSEADKKENKTGNNLQLIFVVSGTDNGDWKEAADQDFTAADKALLRSDFRDTLSTQPAASAPTDPPIIENTVLPALHTARLYQTTFERY